MEIIKSYKDLENEIDIWKTRIETYKAEIRALKQLARIDGPGELSGIDYSAPRVQGSAQLAFEDYIARVRRLESHIYLHEETIENMKKYKEAMEEKIKQLEGIDSKVAYLRDIKGYTLIEISEELGYSHQYIKEVSARNKRAYF